MDNCKFDFLNVLSKPVQIKKLTQLTIDNDKMKFNVSGSLKKWDINGEIMQFCNCESFEIDIKSKELGVMEAVKENVMTYYG